MATNYAPRTTGGTNKSSTPTRFGGQQSKGSFGGGQKKERKPTTHYMVIPGNAETGTDKQFVNGVFLTETQFGLMMSVAPDANIQPGLYFINKKKDKAGDAKPSKYLGE